MRRTVFFSFLGSAFLAASPNVGHAAVSTGVFELRGAEQVPATPSTVVGHGDFAFNDDIHRLTLVVRFVGADIDLDGLQTIDPADDLTGASIHSAPPGANGGIVFDLIADGALIDASNRLLMAVWNENEGVGTTLVEQVPALLAGELYLNIQTNRYPDGELRGQILVPETVPEPSAALLGAASGCLLALGRRRRPRQR